MSGPARDAFVAGIEPRFVPLVGALDRAVLSTGIAFDTAHRYRMLTYGLGGDFRNWICAIDATPRRSGKAVCIRFLFGFLLDDPRHVPRGAKTGPLRILDIASLDELDARLVAGYVTEAVSRLDAFKSGERPRIPGR
jgi:hypothetical protein